MKRLSLTILLFLFINTFSFSASLTDSLNIYLRDSLKSVTLLVQKRIGQSRYMEGRKLSERMDFPGWEGIKVTLYQYQVYDRKAGISKSAKVYLCDASNEVIAKWIISACWQAKHKITRSLIDKILTHIIRESNAQFPVLGIVYEDMKNTGIHIPYVFMDGVTVFPCNIYLGSGALQDSVVNKVLDLSYKKIKDNTGLYGRICSTTREEYTKAGGKLPVGNSSIGNRKITWLSAVRDLYKKALSANENELITAWAKFNL